MNRFTLNSSLKEHLEKLMSMSSLTPEEEKIVLASLECEVAETKQLFEKLDQLRSAMGHVYDDLEELLP